MNYLSGLSEPIFLDFVIIYKSNESRPFDMLLRISRVRQISKNSEIKWRDHGDGSE